MTKDSILNSLRTELTLLGPEIDRIWASQLKLQEQEEGIRVRKKRLETAIREIERVMEVKGEAVKRPAKRKKRLARALAKEPPSSLQESMTVADAVDAEVQEGKFRTAEDILFLISESGIKVRGAETVENIRTVLSRHSRRRGWVKRPGRPARWTRQPKTSHEESS